MFFFDECGKLVITSNIHAYWVESIYHSIVDDAYDFDLAKLDVDFVLRYIINCEHVVDCDDETSLNYNNIVKDILDKFSEET